MHISRGLLFRSFVLISMSLLLISCNTQRQKREFQLYLCESDGESFAQLSRIHYSLIDLGSLGSSLNNYPFRVHHTHAEDLLLMQSDGLFRFEAQSRKFHAIGTGEDFSYMDNSYLQTTEQEGKQYFFNNHKLHLIQDDEPLLVQGGIRACVGLPYSSRLSVLMNDGLSLNDQASPGNWNPTITLPREASRAYHFADWGGIVYLSNNRFYRCAGDGSDEELLFGLNSSVMGYATFFPIDDAGRFITTNRIDDLNCLFLIDAQSGDIQNLGSISYSQTKDHFYRPFQLSMNSDRSKALYFDSTALYSLDLQSLETQTLLMSNTSNLHMRNITGASQSADGRHYAFLADLYKYTK